MALSISLVSGRWKPTILWYLQQGALRYMDLRDSIPDSTERMLIKHLQELEKDGLIIRQKQPGVKGKVVVYSLSEMGMSMIPILAQLEKWGSNYRALKEVI
ncbi:hypothetical protein UNH65_00130 [Chitinophaga sp. 180180018-2]|nr:hypothetical protein [Chitinophaga sp. 212800010-3]